MNENEIGELFRQMRDEPVPADSVARVRLAIDDRIRRRRSWRIPSLVAACAVVLLMAFLVSEDNPRRVAQAPRIAQQEALPLESPRAVPPVVVRPAIRRTRRRVKPATQPIVIRMQTADPDVVILLVGD